MNSALIVSMEANENAGMPQGNEVEDAADVETSRRHFVDFTDMDSFSDSAKHLKILKELCVAHKDSPLDVRQDLAADVQLCIRSFVSGNIWRCSASSKEIKEVIEDATYILTQCPHIGVWDIARWNIERITNYMREIEEREQEVAARVQRRVQEVRYALYP